MHAAFPFDDFFSIVGVAQGEHRVFVLDLLEFISDVAAYALGRGVCVGQLRMGLFERFEFFEQLVEFVVRNRWRVEYVITVIVLVERGGEFGNADAGGVHGAKISREWGVGTGDWGLGTGF